MKTLTRQTVAPLRWDKFLFPLVLFFGLCLANEASGPEGLAMLHPPLPGNDQALSKFDAHNPQLMQKAQWKAKLSKALNSGRDYYSFVPQLANPFARLNHSCLELCTKKEIQQLILNALPVALRPKLQGIIVPTLELADRYQVDPFWVLAVMWTESHYDPSVTSPVGAFGLMQIMPDTGAFLVRTFSQQGDGLFLNTFQKKIRSARSLYKDPLINLEMGIFYLKFLNDLFNKNKKLATVAYNMGPYAVQLRLKNGEAVGQTNRYLKKVELAYKTLAQNFTL